MTDKDQPTPAHASLKPVDGRSVAVAIESKKDGSDSPGKIIASGRGKLAEEIRQLAFSKGVKVREDADLAELLVKLDLDTPIPNEAILAVAEILAKVYEANSRPDIPMPRELR